jgi:hypothetical protein
MGISSTAVLVQLNISTWGTERLDRGQSDRINAINNADSKAGKVHKDLMCGTSLAKDIELYVAKCRLWNNEQTLPWQDRGARLLPTSMFMQYKAEMNKREARFDAMVNKFVPNFEAAKQTASNYLGAMFNEADYPHAEDIARKYRWSLAVSPVPESGHFCIDVPAKELAEVRLSCDSDVERRLAEAMRKPWEDLHSMLLSMSEKLEEVEIPTERDENGELIKPKQRRFHDTFVSNAVEMCDLLRHLNVTGDPKLEEARRKMEIAVRGVDVEDVKESVIVRSQVKSKLDSILGQFDW